MGYFLRAIIASKSEIEHREHKPLVEMIELPQSYYMIPLTVELLLSIYEQGESQSYISGFLYLKASVLDWLAEYSPHGTFAVIENDTFGGVGEQSALIWKNGECVFGPIHTKTDMFEPYGDKNVPLDNAAINQVLHLIGVVKETKDEFSALSLGKHRDTGDWMR